MTEVVEGVDFPDLAKELKAKCPFKQTPPGKNPSKTPEDASEVHENDGGKLGGNLKEGLEGDDGTFNDKCPCKGLQKEPCLDTRTRPKLVLRLKRIPYPFVQAAHHLIPGVGSLENSELFKTYMNEGDKVTTEVKKRKYTIAVNIGYCVNGAHNGVWLPGNYAIRAENPANPKGANWGKISDADFKWNYTIAAIKKCEGRQFHDAHGKYDTKVKGTLNKVCMALVVHQDSDCTTCSNNSGKKIPPPYTIKLRLYGLSKWLKDLLTGPISGWKDPYFTSSKVRKWVMDAKKKKEFMRTYKDISP